MRRSAKRVWFLAGPNTGLLNISGPWEVLGHANDILGRVAYELTLLGPSAPAIGTGHGLVVGKVRSLKGASSRLPDVLIVAGGSPRTPLTEAQAQIVRWIRRHHARIPTIVSICTGAFFLGEAGVLAGRRATTHWQYLDQLKQRFLDTEVIDEGIFVRDGAVWTSAGLMAGIDLTLALVEEDHGHAVAMALAKRLVLFLRRSGHQAQFSAALQRQEKEPPRLRDISTFVLEHLQETLPVQRIASGIGMSPRSLSRWCRTHLDESPAELVRRLRIDEARRLLVETALPLKDITLRTGLGDASTLWRAFTHHLGITPAAYRDRFSSPSRANPRREPPARALVRRKPIPRVAS